MKTFEFTVDGVRYSVNDDNTTVTVAGYPSGNEPTGDLTIPESVTYGGISYPVTSIGDGAFYGCSGLTSIKVESANSVYDSRENCNAIIETATNTLITGCKNTIIPIQISCQIVLFYLFQFFYEVLTDVLSFNITIDIFS